MKKTKEGSQSAYSYLYNIYNYSDSLDFTSIPIQALIDRLVIFSRTNYIEYLYEQLSALYEITDEGTLPKGTYKRFTKLKKGDDELLLLYKPRYYKGRPYFSLTLHEPHGHMMEQVHSIFQKLVIFPMVCTIELTLDFFTEDIIALYN